HIVTVLALTGQHVDVVVIGVATTDDRYARYDGSTGEYLVRSEGCDPTHTAMLCNEGSQAAGGLAGEKLVGRDEREHAIGAKQLERTFEEQGVEVDASKCRRNMVRS